MTKSILRFIDRFYFIFKRFMPLKTYHYAVCGGSNLILDTVLYFVFYHFVFHKENVDVYFTVLSPHIASLFFVFPITLVTGFLMNKFITFTDSDLPWKVQFIRYLQVGISGLFVSYISMKLLVDVIGVYPTPSRFITIVIAVTYSYIMQSKYSFRVKREVEEDGDFPSH